MNTPDWDTYFMSLAYLTSMKSKDPRTKVGAVIVDEDNTIISVGYNGIPRGLEYDRISLIPSYKKYYFEHAERNAIYNSIRTHTKLKNAKLYTTLYPCSACARAIIQTGIKTVIYNNNPGGVSDENLVTGVMLVESGIDIKTFEGKIIKEIKIIEDK